MRDSQKEPWSKPGIAVFESPEDLRVYYEPRASAAELPALRVIEEVMRTMQLRPSAFKRAARR